MSFEVLQALGMRCEGSIVEAGNCDVGDVRLGNVDGQYAYVP